MKTPDFPTADATAENRLVASGLSHAYGRAEVLRDVSFSVEPGEMVCLVGPSGCGKSTLLRLVAGLEHVQTGAIRLDGEEIASVGSHMPPERRDIGLVFQDFALFPHMSLLENVAFGLAAYPRAERRRMALDMLARVGLAQRADEPPHVLSGGQQQRVALARAMAPRPRLMLLDEPFSNLDVRLRHRMRIDTLRLLKDSHTASVLVTHDPQEAMFMADRIALMNEGRIVQIGSPADVYSRPADPFAALFFGEMNQLYGIVQHEKVATPLGVFDAPRMRAGAPAEVLIRPQALMPGAADHHTVAARVVTCRLLGGTCLVSLRTASEATGEIDFMAEIPSTASCQPGELLHLRIDPRGVFVFPSPPVSQQLRDNGSNLP